MKVIIGRIALFPLFGISAVALVWATEFGSQFWTYAPLDGIASRIIRFDNLPSDLLESTIPAIEVLERSGRCLPKAMHNAAIIRGRMVQIAIDNSDPDDARQAAVAANAMIRKSLSCAPEDSFLWFALFWLEGLQYGFSEELIGYLSKSYELGPYEGWIALRRNKYALIVYPLLPRPLQDRVVKEFAALVNSGFIRETKDNLMGPGWPIRDTLLASLSEVDQKYKRWLANELRRAGVEVSIPGLIMPELRPWQVD